VSRFHFGLRSHAFIVSKSKSYACLGNAGGRSADIWIENRQAMTRVVIVGAGPAGIAAADVLVAHGMRPLLIDEGRHPGGQAYRRPADFFAYSIETLLGSEAARYHRIHRRFKEIRSQLDYRPETLAWNVFDREVHTAGRGCAEAHHCDALILAPGAVERVLPIPGWTLPGVVTLGGAQILLKEQGCLVGRRMVFCGSSPLLYLAALQCRRMGAEVAAVLDATPFAAKRRALAKLLASPATLRRGLGYLVTLRRLGVPVRHGVRLLAFEGRTEIETVRYRDAAGEGRIACDAVAVGFGLRPETQLAELAGCSLAYDADFRQWLPVRDGDGRGGPGLYLAGDGASIGGAEAAEIAGRLAAFALLEDSGQPPPAALRARLHRRLARLDRFQRGLAAAFAWPQAWLKDLPDETIVCRCEEVSAGALRRAAQASFGAGELNRLKAFTRCGMGRCQGRFCALAAGELAAATLGRPHREMGWMRAQAPVKPLPVRTIFHE
jgi:NADPH-dependent 2,4-dienoyl-CoA reductase/sulfur reductase-like enzyme